MKSSLLQPLANRAQDKEAYQQRMALIRRDAAAVPSGQATGDATAEPDQIAARSGETRRRRLKSAGGKLYWWAARIVLIALLILLVTFILFFWGTSRRPTPTVVSVEVPSRLTAMRSSTVAMSLAREWSEDAQLVAVSASWDAGQDFQSGEGDWSLIYYSPAAAATALISVYEGRPTIVTTHGVAKPVAVQDEARWKIDSPAAVDQLLAAGGNDFLRGKPTTSLSMSLDLTGDAIWKVRLIDQESRRIFSAQVGIEDGQVTDVQQSG